MFIFFKCPKYLRDSDRVDYNDCINGVYQLGEETHDGKAIYVKPGGQGMIRWFAQQSQWVFDSRQANFDEEDNVSSKKNKLGDASVFFFRL